ncbi:MAG: hypothetical protein SVU94_09565 [Bacteroidota bacterium]|nr:hypothetical protein [Bacteroidota bacterium]
MHFSLYSQNSPDFISENDVIQESINQVSNAIGNKDIGVIDRGGDRYTLYSKHRLITIEILSLE